MDQAQGYLHQDGDGPAVCYVERRMKVLFSDSDAKLLTLRVCFSYKRQAVGTKLMLSSIFIVINHVPQGRPAAGSDFVKKRPQSC